MPAVNLPPLERDGGRDEARPASPAGRSGDAILSGYAACCFLGGNDGRNAFTLRRARSGRPVPKGTASLRPRTMNSFRRKHEKPSAPRAVG